VRRPHIKLTCEFRCGLLQGDKGRRQYSAEDPGQSISLLNHTRQDHDLYGYTDDASTSDGDDGAMAETVLDSPPAATPDVDGAPTALSSTSGSGSSSTRVKEPPQNAMKLPLDQTDYLQPQSSLPATYLDLVASPGTGAMYLCNSRNHHHHHHHHHSYAVRRPRQRLCDQSYLFVCHSVCLLAGSNLPISLRLDVMIEPTNGKICLVFSGNPVPDTDLQSPDHFSTSLTIA